MNETGVLGRFIRAFGQIVAMMQFNMYHHYTVDEHLLRCIGVLQDIERGSNDEFTARQRPDRKIRSSIARCSISRCSCTTSPRAGPRIIRSPARRSRASCVRASASTPPTPRLIAWLIEQHLTMSTVAQSRDLSDRKTIENFAAVVAVAGAIEAADDPHHRRHPRRRPRRLERLEGAAYSHAVFRNRAGADRRLLRGEPRAAHRDGAGRIPRTPSPNGRRNELDAYIGRHYPAYWLKVDLARKVRHAKFVRASENSEHKLAVNVGFDEARGVTELTILATDHPWLLSIIAGACASAGANIVDAQIYTTTDGLALDTISISREYDRDEDEGRRAQRIGEMIEQALRGEVRLPEVVARRAAGRKTRPFVVEPEVTINNQWSDRYTVIEVSGLDRPGLLYDLTTAISKLNLNIASAHVATFGERARDVFYVTDLLGAQITAPTRQAAIMSFRRSRSPLK